MSTALPELGSWSRGAAGGAAAVAVAALVGVAATVSPAAALAGAIGLVFVAVTLRSLPAGLAVFTVLTFFERIAGVTGSASLVKVAGVVLAGSWALSLLRRRGGDVPLLFRDHPALSYAVVALCGWAIASMLWAPNVEIARFNASRLVQVVVFLFIVYTALARRAHVRWVVLAFVTGAALTALVGLAGGSSAESFAPGEETSRLVGSIGDPNELAAILVPALAFALFGLAAFHSPLVRWLLGSCALVIAIGLFLTQSRGGLVGLAVMSLAAIALAGRLRPRVVAAVLSIGALGLGYYTLVAPPESLQRVTNFAAEGGTGRTDLWSIAVEVTRDHPIAGVGIGNFVVVEPTYASRTISISEVRLVVDTPKIAHNMYLQVLSELGIVGLVLFLGVLGSSLALALRAVAASRRRGDESMEMIGRGVVVGLLGMLAAYTFISAQYEKQLWLLFGLSTALYSVSRRAAAESTPAETRIVAASPLPPRPPRRTQSAAEAPEYDPAVSERLVEQLEQRLTERLDALLEEQERLDRRRSAVAARERELRDRARSLEALERERLVEEARIEAERRELDARVDIVRTLELAHDTGREELESLRRELDERREREDERERRLAAREQAVEEAERLREALAEREAALEARAREVEEAARSTQEQGIELRAASEALAEREQALEGRARELEVAAQRLAEAERREAELERREAELERREAALEARAREVEDAERLREALAEREAALAARERELEEEARSAQEQGAELRAASEALVERERALEARARELEVAAERFAEAERREAELEQREEALDARARELEDAEARSAEEQSDELRAASEALAERERALEARARELEGAAERLAEAERREAELERREAALAARAREEEEAAARAAEERSAELRAASDALGEREAALEARARELEVVAERLADAERREAELDRRETALEARAREVEEAAARTAEERTVELRAASEALAEREAALEARAREIEVAAERLADAERREAELDRREAALEARAREAEEAATRAAEERSAELRAASEALAEREQALERRARELEGAAERLAEAERLDAELQRREQELEARVRAVTARELEVARAASAAAPAAAPSQAATTAAEQPAAPPAAPAAPEPVAPRPAEMAAWSLPELERLVAANRDAPPERREEWESYLLSLRDFADELGRLPATFDALLEEVFRELLLR